MLTRKHFKAIAKIIEGHTFELHDDVHNHYQVLPRNAVAIEIAHVLVETNPRFDESKFLRACGLKI